MFARESVLGTQRLVTRPFKPDGAKGSDVARLEECIERNLDTLQEGPIDILLGCTTKQIVVL
jgi:hypothetical protein